MRQAVGQRLDDKTSDTDHKTSDNGTAMAEFKKHWDDRETQARTTAKWIATALGAALAALVGTAPRYFAPKISAPFWG